MNAEFINQNHNFFPEVIALGNKHSSTLGFMPKVLFQKNKHYGIYEWKNIYDLCNSNIENSIRALRFSGTEVFMNPVKLSSVREVFMANGKPSNTFASPVRIGSNIFNQIYQTGIREKRL